MHMHKYNLLAQLDEIILDLSKAISKEENNDNVVKLGEIQTHFIKAQKLIYQFNQ